MALWHSHKEAITFGVHLMVMVACQALSSVRDSQSAHLLLQIMIVLELLSTGDLRNHLLKSKETYVQSLLYKVHVCLIAHLIMWRRFHIQSHDCYEFLCL